MIDHKIEFQKIAWESIAIGVKQKSYESGLKKVRLMHLTDDFVELDWCTKGHIGYVLEGEMILNFIDKKANYNKGNVFIINSGEAEKHKAIISKGHFVELLLIEELKTN